MAAKEHVPDTGLDVGMLRTPPVIAPGHTFDSVTNTISAVVLTKRTPIGWFFGFAVAFALLMLLNVTIAKLLLTGARILLKLDADVNAVDHEGNTAMHNAAARGDVEMILYLVAKGADPKAVNREGKTTADMANGPVQRIQPWPEALALLEKLGAVNNHRCVSC